jgi:hypothetical protein
VLVCRYAAGLFGVAGSSLADHARLARNPYCPLIPSII